LDSDSDITSELAKQRKDGNQPFKTDNQTNPCKEFTQRAPMTSTIKDEGGDEGGDEREDKIEKIEDFYNGDGQLWYKVKWAGEIKATWEPAIFLENVQNASRSNWSSTRSGN
jgi:hypothetical protein